MVINPDTNSDGSTHSCQLNNINNTIITHRRSPHGYHPCLITCHHGYLPDTNSDGSTHSCQLNNINNTIITHTGGHLMVIIHV